MLGRKGMPMLWERRQEKESSINSAGSQLDVSA